MRWPWLLRVLWSPDIELDLVDDAGKVQHGKVVGLVFVLLMLGAEALKVSFSLGKMIVLASAIFGSKMFYEFLQSKVATASESRMETETHAVTETIEHRDEARGVDPSP